MVKVNLKTEKLNQVKETFRVSYRTLGLIWKVDKWLFIAAFITAVIPAVVPYLTGYVAKLVIDLVVGVVSGKQLDQGLLYTLIGFSILVYFFQSATYATQAYVDRLLWTKLPIYFNQLFLGKLTSLDVQYFEDPRFRDLIEKAKEGFEFRPHNLINSIYFGFQSLIQFLIGFIALTKFNWFFLILIVIISIPEFINNFYQSKLSWTIWDKNSPFRKRYDYLTHLLKGPREYKEIKLFTLAKKILAEIKEIQTKFYVENKKIASRGYKVNLGLDVLSTLSFMGIQLFIILQALAKKVTVGDIGFYSSVVSGFQNGLGGLLRNITSVFDQSLYMQSVFEVLDAKPLLYISTNPVRTNFKKAPRIKFKDVTFSYPGSSKKILKDFNLTLNPGEKVAFVGENGAGKTTIIKLLARFYDVDSGEILINGINIKNLDLENWYHHLGVLFQDFNKYEHTVKENIYFGKVHEDLDMKGIIEAATSAGAHAMVSKFDKGYEQILGKMFEGGIELSGGQWQKVALARAFFRNAPVLVLDEPTASIDAKAESEIFSRVEKLSKDKTVIIISHRFSTVRNADKIYVIDNGKVIETGTHKELMKLNGQYANLFNLQAKGYL